MKKLLAYLPALIALILFPTLTGGGSGSAYAAEPDETGMRDSIPVAKADSLRIEDVRADSIAGDSFGGEGFDAPLQAVPAPEAPKKASRMRYNKTDLENPVTFTSSDSMVIVRRDSAFMFGKSEVHYGDISLAAAEIQMDLSDNTVYAVGAPDSTGEIQGRPVFTDDGTDYEAKTMRYNFKTEKGYITDVVTQQGEGYLTGGTTKKGPDKVFYIRNGRYTTCDNHDDPHFYLNITKGRVEPGKNVVTGPAYMVLEGVPLPLAVPFGYFPFSESYASGIIVPSFGEDYNRGFYLDNGGYYFAISDNVDLALTGEIYTKGSWGVQARSNYAKRYRFTGNFNFSYIKTIMGEKGSPDYSASTNFQVLWSHQLDAKANPNMSLSASVNFATSGYSRNDVNSYYTSAFTENTKSSTVNMTYRFPQSKWSLSTTFNLSQRTQDSTLAVSFPNVTITMSQTYPFKRKRAIGAERWYEKIKLSYSGQLQNSLTAKQNVFFKKSLIKDWRNAMRHNVPISATFNVMKYFNVTPSLNLTDRMYTSKVRRHWDEERAVEAADTTYGFYNVWDFTASVSMDTKIYGFFQPIGFLGKKIKMIRHVMTPSISFSGAPDFSSPFFGYYDTYVRPNTNQGTIERRKYSLFPNALFGVPGQGQSGTIGLSLSNNLEMKVATNDSVGEKKISLIENLNISESYNLAADSLRWSDLSTSILLRLTKGFNLNLSATWDMYTYALNAAGNPVRVDRTRFQAGKLPRLMRTGTSFSYNFNNDTFRKKGGGNQRGNQDNNREGDEGDENNNARRGGRRDEGGDGSDEPEVNGGYVKWECPWNLSVNYSVSYAYGAFNKEKMEYDSKITQNLSLSGNIRPTPNWNFSFTASYNFDTKKLAYMNCNISRDLHCFTMTASFVPVGPYKSYNFHIAVKSSLLSDLKYDRRSSLSNGISWY